MNFPPMHILDRNACRSCRRPISLVHQIGWLHSELPQYAHEELTCQRAVPVDPRCPQCDDLVSASNVSDGCMKLAMHVPSGATLPCSGSGFVVASPT